MGQILNFILIVGRGDPTRRKFDVELVIYCTNNCRGAHCASADLILRWLLYKCRDDLWSSANLIIRWLYRRYIGLIPTACRGRPYYNFTFCATNLPTNPANIHFNISPGTNNKKPFVRNHANPLLPLFIIFATKNK